MSKIILMSKETSVMKSVSEELKNTGEKLVFIDTASNGQSGDKKWLENQKDSIREAGFDMDIYSIEGKNQQNFEQDLVQYDIIHIGGGNTAYLLFHIQQTGFDKYLRNVAHTKTIIGSSAGAIVMGETIQHVEPLDDFTVVSLDSYQALGFVNFAIMVHFGVEKYSKKYQDIFTIAYKKTSNGLYLDDFSYIVLEDNAFRLVNIKNN